VTRHGVFAGLQRHRSDSIPGVTITPDMIPDDIDTLKAALIAERAEHRGGE
jgi:hypothetical protein